MDREKANNEKHSGGAGANPNRRRSWYLVNLIILSLIAIAGVVLAGLLFFRERSAASELADTKKQLAALEGDDKTLYTEEEVEKREEAARMTGEREEQNAIQTQIQSSLESGNSVTTMLRDLFSDDLVVVSDGRYYFYPVISSVEKNGFGDGDFAFADDGTMTYQGSNDQIVTRQGIDVSSANGTIDWDAVAESGIEFAMICAGGRNDSGDLYVDSKFAENMDGALAAGVEVGVYWSLGAKNGAEASEEEDYLLTLLSPYREKITYPVAALIRSVSADSRIYSLTRAEWSSNLDTFCSGVDAGGYDAMIYGSLAGFVMKTDLTAIDGYDRWIQEFSDDLYFPYSFRLWQYESEGSVAGIDTAVHLDLAVSTSG
jgi:lysozyme